MYGTPAEIILFGKNRPLRPLIYFTLDGLHVYETGSEFFEVHNLYIIQKIWRNILNQNVNPHL